NSLGNLSVKGTANVTGATTFNDDVTVADGKTINTENITLNSKAIPSGGGMVCVDNVWKIQLETGDECSFSAFVNQDLDISYTNEICDEI
ncbi:MAG: hypothetical protein ACPGTS_02425, partial [Minisyncoccia bacterium]